MWDAAVSICWIVCSEAEGGLSCRRRMLCALASSICRWDELKWVLVRINHPGGGRRLCPGDNQVLGTERTSPERRRWPGSKQRLGIKSVQQLLPSSRGSSWIPYAPSACFPWQSPALSHEKHPHQDLLDGAELTPGEMQKAKKYWK